MSGGTREELAIRKEVTVGLPVDRAFDLFFARASEWWPLVTHSVHGERAIAAVLEPREGGRFYERTAEGEEADWGRVLAFEPPHRVLLEWVVDPRCSGTLELRFVPDEAGTRVELEHRGWEGYGADAEAMLSRYATGWDGVLARYTAAAAE